MNTKIALLAALAPVSIAVAFTFAAPVQAKSLADSCHAGNKNKVVSCCNSWVKTNGLPLWMNGSNSCKAAAVCVGGGGSPGVIAALVINRPPSCYLQRTLLDTPSAKTPPTRGRTGRN